jgi:hypothetical protein
MQRCKIRETRDKSCIPLLHPRHLGLLEHYLGDQDPIRVTRIPPREIPAVVPVEAIDPFSEFLGSEPRSFMSCHHDQAPRSGQHTGRHQISVSALQHSCTGSCQRRAFPATPGRACQNTRQLLHTRSGHARPVHTGC